MVCGGKKQTFGVQSIIKPSILKSSICSKILPKTGICNQVQRNGKPVPIQGQWGHFYSSTFISCQILKWLYPHRYNLVLLIPLGSCSYLNSPAASQRPSKYPLCTLTPDYQTKRMRPRCLTHTQGLWLSLSVHSSPLPKRPCRSHPHLIFSLSLSKRYSQMRNLFFFFWVPIL